MRDSSEQKVSTQDPKFMTITKFAWEEKAQQVKTLESKVEEMKKALEWYADESNYEIYTIDTEENGVIVQTEYWYNVTKDEGERARQALKGVKTK